MYDFGLLDVTSVILGIRLSALSCQTSYTICIWVPSIFLFFFINCHNSVVNILKLNDTATTWHGESQCEEKKSREKVGAEREKKQRENRRGEFGA